MNTLAAGDGVVLFDHGFFAGKWARVAEGLGLEVHRIEGDWSRAPDPEALVPVSLGVDL